MSSHRIAIPPFWRRAAQWLEIALVPNSMHASASERNPRDCEEISMRDRIERSFLVDVSSSLLDHMKDTKSILRGYVELFGENANGEYPMNSD